jgi:hypothetical protein
VVQRRELGQEMNRWGEVGDGLEQAPTSCAVWLCALTAGPELGPDLAGEQGEATEEEGAKKMGVEGVYHHDPWTQGWCLSHHPVVVILLVYQELVRLRQQPHCGTAGPELGQDLPDEQGEVTEGEGVNKMGAEGVCHPGPWAQGRHLSHHPVVVILHVYQVLVPLYQHPHRAMPVNGALKLDHGDEHAGVMEPICECENPPYKEQVEVAQGRAKEQGVVEHHGEIILEILLKILYWHWIYQW